jgi:hypothetical protein
MRKPNLKLRRVLERRGFVVKNVDELVKPITCWNRLAIPLLVSGILSVNAGFRHLRKTAYDLLIPASNHQ